MSKKQAKLQQLNKNLEELVEISFKYFQNFYFDTDKCSTNKQWTNETNLDEFNKINSQLQAIYQKNFTQIKRENSGIFTHYGKWEEVSTNCNLCCKEYMNKIKEILQNDIEIYRLTIRGKQKIILFQINGSNTLYVLCFDLEHKFYKSELKGS